VAHSINENQPESFTDILRVRFKGILDPIGAYLNSLGLYPNTITILGLIGNMFAAFLIARGSIVWGGVVILLMGPLDAIDGTMARLRGQPTRFGAILDSVVDRYSELVVLGGLLIYFTQQANWQAVILCYLAAGGSVLVSYVKARAEAANYPVKGGMLTRVERYIITVFFLIINHPLIALWILAILANATALQRLWLVHKQAVAEQDILK
jgi:CDP-diacylglycerol--glycerol-3-phosphate 3-phosphatidyltransferase